MAQIIRDIRVVNQAEEVFSISSISAFTSFSIGEEVPDQETILSSIAADVSRMRESGRFTYVNARMDVEEDEIVLVYTVAPKHRLRRIEIVGGKKNGRWVREKSNLEIGQFTDDSTFEIAAAKIRESYKDEWHPYAKVTWKAKTDGELGTVDVTFHIDEREKIGIKRLVFEGTQTIKNKTLRKLMQQKQKNWLSFITGSGKYREEFADSDVFAIKSFYMNSGFLDIRISDPVLDALNPKKAKLIFTIDEGERYRVGIISVSGMEVFTEEELLRDIRLKSGETASYKHTEAVSETIRSYYGNRGYIHTSVRPEYNTDVQNGVVDVTYHVLEGMVGHINTVNISGNERTLDKVIRRELVIYPGEKYNRSRIRTSENRLFNLNYFETVTINPQQTSESGKYDINVQVKEKPTGQFTIGTGFSSIDSLVGYVEFAQGNFNWKTWPPLGAGQKLKIRAQLGTRRNDLDISFVEPWFLNRKLSFGIDLYHREARYFSDSYDQKNDGIRLSLGKPLSRFSRGNLSYTLEQFDVFDVDESASQAIQDEEGRRLKSSLAYTWTFDTRDRFFNPTRGNRIVISPYTAGGIFGGETKLYGVRARSGHYWPLLWDAIFNIRGQVESVEAFGNREEDFGTYGDGVPIFDRLFLGGAYTLRGFEYRDVGPIDTSTEDPVGGNTSAYATAELTVPLWSQIRAAIFYDWGFVNTDSWDFNTANYHDNWGIGLRLNLPGFPLQLDYAWPISYDERHLDGQGRFNFNIGHIF